MCYNVSMMKKLITLIFIPLLFTLSACLPQQHPIWATLTPQQQQGVLAHEASKVASKDCYTAISKHWPANLHAWGRSIVWRESRNTPSAANRSSTARGCWQMLMSLHAKRFYAVGCTPAQWANPDCNSKAAYHLYKAAGKSPWKL